MIISANLCLERGMLVITLWVGLGWNMPCGDSFLFCHAAVYKQAPDHPAMSQANYIASSELMANLSCQTSCQKLKRYNRLTGH